MILGSERIQQLVEQGLLVEGLGERDRWNPEGAGVDLRVARLYEIEGNGSLGILDRQTPRTRIVLEYVAGESRWFTIRPGEYYLVDTIESVNLPSFITGHLTQRSTVFRSGVQVLTANINPGYRGKLTVGLHNIGPCPFRLEMGARILFLQFSLVEGSTTTYQGQWQGGRVSTEGKVEQQV